MALSCSWHSSWEFSSSSPGLVSVILGLIKSRNLNIVRNELKKDGKGVDDQFVKFARTNPNVGLTPEEFERMSMSQSNPVRFQGSDLGLVFSGISSDPNRMFIS